MCVTWSKFMLSANQKPFRIAFGFVFCGYENFIVHNCEMKKSFNFDKVSFLSEQPEKSTDFLSSFLETQVCFQVRFPVREGPKMTVTKIWLYMHSKVQNGPPQKKKSMAHLGIVDYHVISSCWKIPDWPIFPFFTIKMGLFGIIQHIVLNLKMGHWYPL